MGATLRTVLNQRIRRELRRPNGSWRIDETYIRVARSWAYLYRAVDSAGETIESCHRRERSRAMLETVRVVLEVLVNALHQGCITPGSWHLLLRCPMLTHRGCAESATCAPRDPGGPGRWRRNVSRLTRSHGIDPFARDDAGVEHRKSCSIGFHCENSSSGQRGVRFV
jgi:hypothetical protein